MITNLQELIQAHRSAADDFADFYSTLDIEVGYDRIVTYIIWSGTKEVFIKGPTFQSALDGYNDLMNGIVQDLNLDV